MGLLEGVIEGDRAECHNECLTKEKVCTGCTNELACACSLDEQGAKGGIGRIMPEAKLPAQEEGDHTTNAKKETIDYIKENIAGLAATTGERGTKGEIWKNPTDMTATAEILRNR